MKEWLSGLNLDQYFTGGLLLKIAGIALTLLVGWTIARLISSGLGKILERRSTPQTAMIFRRAVFYTLICIILASALSQAGFKLGVLLGAAGVLTVAVGFASQTSASNLMSGLFIIAERPFVVGDIIEVDNLVGEVLSVDLLSVKIRTFDNLYVRIPNENIIKSPITNFTHFPIRRIDVKLGVAYKEDVARVKRVLFEVADRNPLCLKEPKPLYIFKGYGDSSLNIQFSVWVNREQFIDLTNSIHEDIKAAFDESGIEMPFPHRTLYTGAATDPFPVRLVGGEKTPGPASVPPAKS